MAEDAKSRCMETVKLLQEFLDRELTTCEVQTVDRKSVV